MTLSYNRSFSQLYTSPPEWHEDIENKGREQFLVRGVSEIGHLDCSFLELVWQNAREGTANQSVSNLHLISVMSLLSGLRQSTFPQPYWQ